MRSVHVWRWCWTKFCLTLYHVIQLVESHDRGTLFFLFEVAILFRSVVIPVVQLLFHAWSSLPILLWNVFYALLFHCIVLWRVIFKPHALGPQQHLCECPSCTGVAMGEWPAIGAWLDGVNVKKITQRTFQWWAWRASSRWDGSGEFGLTCYSFRY